MQLVVPPYDRCYHQSIAHGHYTMWRCFWGSGHCHTTHDAIGRSIPRLIVYGYKSYDFLRYYGSCHRSSPIVFDRATTRTTNRTMTYHQQKYRSQYATASGYHSKHCRSVARSPTSQPVVRSRNRTIRCECGLTL